MVSTPSQTGFLDSQLAASTPSSCTSTPDSGYFASGSRASVHSHINLPCYLSYEEDSGVASQDDSHAAATPGTSTLRKYVEKSYIDFLPRLEQFKPVVSKVLASLPDHDLAMVCCTSREWRRVCHSVPEAKRRWKAYIELKRNVWECSRENMPSKRQPAHRGEEVPHPLAVRNSNSNNDDSDKGQLGAVVYKSRFQIYVEEAKRLKKGEWHLACPKCNYPSRASPDTTCATCKSPTCMYLFCGHCKRPPHEVGQQCPKLSVAASSSQGKKQVIGGKHSKRQLRRL